MVKPELNATDYGVLHAIGDYWALHGYAPGLRELIGASPTVNSTSTVKYRLRSLIVFGLVRLSGAPERNICLTPAAFAHLHSTDVVTRLTLPYPVSVNRLWKARRGGGLMLSDEGKAYKQQAGYAGLEQVRGRDILAGPLAYSARFYRPAFRGDLDNLPKALLDSMNKIVYDDDRQFVEQHSYLAHDSANPRVEIEIWKVR